MGGLAWITCLWPGLPRLWWRGDWRALGSALAFAASVNLALLGSLVWEHSLPHWLLTAGWLAIGLIWLFSAWIGKGALSKLRDSRAGLENDDLFIRAQREYLNRHWLEAEELLLELVSLRDQDAEARLMLATLYRRTGRKADAEACLLRLERLDGGDRWRGEVARERRMLEGSSPSAVRRVPDGADCDE